MNEIPEIVSALFQMWSGLICLLDTDGYIKLVNDSGAQQLGYTADELLNENITRPNGLNAKMSEAFWDELKAKNTYNKTLNIVHKNGQRKTWEFNSNLVNYKNQNYYLILGTDRTEKFESQKDLEIADKLYDLNLNRLHKTLLDLQKAKTLAEETAKIKQQFLANVSHEIRTPMNAIIGFSNILLKANLKSQEQQYVGAIKKSSDILMNIINEILDLSKLESGNFSFDETDFDLVEILESVKLLFELKIADKNIEFAFEYNPNLTTNIVGDPGRLYQILVNIVGNSIKFTDRGYVKVMVEQINETNDNIILRFTVKDTGIGIEEKNIEKIFESFTQASSDTTRKYGGTGLGLTISKQMVELQGGNIYATSEIGKGSAFIFELPFKLSNLNMPSTNEIANDFYFNRNDSLGKYKILIVEDNEINILLATKIIEDWGFQYSVAVNGLKAIECLDIEHFDLVMMDVQMPEMDGYQAAREIRKSKKKYTHIPIIATTAHAAKDEADKALAAGMNDYVSKPFQLEVLLQKILKLLNNEDAETINKNAFDTNSQLTNLNYLNRVAAGDVAFVEKMIKLFIAQTPDAVQSIKEDMMANNWQNFRSKIHKLMPSISFMGITALSNELHEIDETKTIPDDLKIFEWVVQQLEQIVKQGCDELSAYLSNK